MANWALVDNGIILELHDLLPVNWKNVSGLRLLENDKPALKSLGWLPVNKETESFDTNLFFIDSRNYTVFDSYVQETFNLSPRPVDPVPSLEELKEQFLTELRIERNKKLSESDWTQLVDVQDKFDELTKSRWAEYRQRLRDLPETYLNLNIYTLSEVVWPVV